MLGTVWIAWQTDSTLPDNNGTKQSFSHLSKLSKTIYRNHGKVPPNLSTFTITIDVKATVQYKSIFIRKGET